MSVRVRFAPSPTGPLHIGGARSALFNWLFARRHGGGFIVRVEDTDLERSSREAENNILDALKWLGLDWDEGVGVGGKNSPYRQTERLKMYRWYAGELLASGHAYHCYCTTAELATERETLLAKGTMPRYLGRCRNLNDSERQQLENEGRRPVLRFKVPENKIIKINDLVRGQVEFDCAGIGDYVIMKSDQDQHLGSVPTYNFAVVVDDYLMEITHVIRAEEHLSNTPRQILIYEALAWKEPIFAHVSLILGSDRSKMSKRHGATAIEQYQALGYLPEAMVNFMALLGWSPGGEEEIFTLSELQKIFSLDRVSKSPAVFDLEKLNWLNGGYIRQSDLDYITGLCLPYLQKAGYLSADINAEERQTAREIIRVTRDSLVNISEIVAHAAMFYEKQVIIKNDQAQAVLAGEQVPQVLQAMKQKITTAGQLDEDIIKKMLKQLTKELGFGGKKIFMPLRVALTGRTSGPELYQIIPILGSERTVNRLNNMIKSIYSKNRERGSSLV